MTLTTPFAGWQRPGSHRDAARRVRIAGAAPTFGHLA